MHGAQATKAGREWFCNADFDLTLAQPQVSLPERLQSMARNMAWHFWPTLGEGDTLLVPEAPASEHLEYWRGLELPLPHFGTKANPERLFTPFGWNADAVKREKGYRLRGPHPDPAIVAKVNSRKFTLQLEKELFPEIGPGGVLIENFDALQSWLAGKHPGRWVAKGNHGHGGIGQLRFDFENPMPDLGDKLHRLLTEQAGLLLEPEHQIHVEFGLLFLIRQDGALSGLRHHRLLSRAGGGFAGALGLMQDTEFESRYLEVEKAIVAIAARLYGEGYFGPVSIDAYIHRQGDVLRLRPLVDLNARCSMAYPVHGLAQRLPHRVIWVSQISTRTLRLPVSMAELKSILGNLHFNPNTGCGAFWITPLIAGIRRQGIACIGKDEAGVSNLRQELLKGLARG